MNKNLILWILLSVIMLTLSCSQQNQTRENITPVDSLLPEERLPQSDTLIGILQSGENITLLIERICGERINATEAATAFSTVFQPEYCRQGESLLVILDQDEVDRLIYIKKADQIFQVTRNDTIWFADTVFQPVDYVPVVISGTICNNTPSLWESILYSGGTDELAGTFCNLLECQVDFTFSSRDGDSFCVVYFKKYLQGEYIGRTLLLKGIYQGSLSSGDAYLYPSEEFSHFSSDGQSALRKFLSSPVSYTRISSGFSRSRFHPILGYNRAHRGVDYSAPTGTPVSAIAKGTVILAGRLGEPGIAVRIKHSDGFESEYYHLSRIADGITVGKRVEQGQIIGYVGSTGLSTGPHLHFGIKINGTHVDPVPVLARSSGEPVPQEEKQLFQGSLRFYQLLEKASLELSSLELQRQSIMHIW